MTGQVNDQERSPEHADRASLAKNESVPRRLLRWGSQLRQSSYQPRPLITDVVVFYGTMFGSAEQYARTLAHCLSTQTNTQVAVNDLDGFDSASITERLTLTRLFVFVVSTHFAGGPSPSAERFRDWINHLVSLRHGDANHSVRFAQIPPHESLPRVRSRAKDNWLGFIRRFRGHRKPLHEMLFAVFGVGDSAYETFNAMGKFVDAKLKLLGATPIQPLGLGDCSNDLELTFLSWKTSLIRQLPPRSDANTFDTISEASTKATITLNLSAMSLSASRLTSFSSSTSESQRKKERRTSKNTAVTPSPFTPSLMVRDNFGRPLRLRFRCRILVNETVRDRPGSPPGNGPRTPRVAIFDDKPFADVEPVEFIGGSSRVATLSRRLPRTQSVKREIGIFRVRLLNADISYTTASTLALFPRNSPEVVERIAQAFCFDLDAVMDLVVDEHDRSRDLHQLPFPTPCTVRTALIEFVELRTVTRDFLRIASGYVVTMDEKDMLETLSSTEAFRTEISESHKTVLDVVAMAPTLQIPLEVLVNISQPIKPRYFTIASSPVVSPRSFEIAVSLGQPTQPHGLAVSFLDRTLASQTSTRTPIRGFITSSRIQFVDDWHSPIVFIAMGVSISPMRAILQERFAKFLQSQNAPLTSPPKHILFLGASNEDSVVFRDSLRHWEQQMFLTVHYAFSNDTRHTRQYVQDVVASRTDEIYQVVKSSTTSRIMVCGRITLGRRVRELFQADQLRRSGRWFDDILHSDRFIDEVFA